MGNRLNDLPTWGVQISSHRHEKSGAMKLHEHDYPSLLVVTDGRGGCSLNGIDHSLHEDMVVFVPPHVSHETYDNPGHPMNVYSLGYRESLSQMSEASYVRLMQSSKPLCLTVYGAKQVNIYLRSLLHEQKQQAPEFEVAMQALLNRVLIQVFRNSQAQTSFGGEHDDSLSKVRSVLRDLEENYHRHHPLGEAAKMAHLSQRQFSNLCHQILGSNYVAWINDIRCARAMDLLLETKMPVSSIAFEVGFEEISTFYRAFKKKYDQAPRSFRV